MSKKFHLRERLFLNLNLEMRAYIIAVIEDTRDIASENENEWKWGRIELKMADCVDEVSFDFNLSSKENRENSLHKVREMARVLNAFRDALEIEAEAIEERLAFSPLKAAAATVH